LYSMRKSIFYVDGKFIPENQASINVSDLGLLRGYGIFDFTRTYDREPFRLKEHIERLENSAKKIGLDLPWNKKELIEITYRTLRKNSEGEKGVRIVVTGGRTLDSFHPASKPSLIIMVSPVPIYPSRCYDEGIKVITFPGKREIPEAKTLNYIHAIKALNRGRREGAEEALYTYDGIVSECMVCSFFAVKDGRIITAGKDILEGITRRTVLELVKDRIPIDYRFVRVPEFDTLDEAFLSSSAHEIMPIVTVDDTKISDGKPGPITKEVIEMFRNYTRNKSW
jgi:branched-chain amino acid aminotransferase